MIVQGFYDGGHPLLMDFSCRRVGLPGGRFLLFLRHHRKRTGIGQRLDGFMGLRHLIFGQRTLQRKERVQTFLFRRLLIGQYTLEKVHRFFGRMGVFKLLFAHGGMDFLPGLSAELDARAQRTASAQPGGLRGLAVHILGFHGFARHSLPLERGGIAFLECDQRPHDGGRFRFDGADDVLRGQQNFRTDGLCFRRCVGIDRLNGFGLRRRDDGPDGAAAAASGPDLSRKNRYQQSQKNFFHSSLAISLAISRMTLTTSPSASLWSSTLRLRRSTSALAEPPGKRAASRRRVSDGPRR